MTEDQFRAWLLRQGKPKDRALEQYKYGDPANFVKYPREKDNNMQAIRKLDEVFHEKRNPVDEILDVWSYWMRLKDAAFSESLADPCDVKDAMTIAEAVETMVNDLKRHQWWAIRKSRGICSVWIFKDEHYENHLTQAREILEKKMRTHIATRRFFG